MLRLVVNNIHEIVLWVMLISLSMILACAPSIVTEKKQMDDYYTVKEYRMASGNWCYTYREQLSCVHVAAER
jgi:hypothetical protein